MSAPLYNRQILRLAASMSAHTRLKEPGASVEKRSPICGSVVVVDVRLDADGALSALGMQVQACALGQASAALMAGHAIGRTRAELAAARDQLANWLAGTRRELPDWPDISALEPALPHSARHASIRLAFEGVVDAMALAQTAAVPMVDQETAQ